MNRELTQSSAPSESEVAIMSSQNFSLTGNTLLPNEARWDELTEHLPASLSDLEGWFDVQLSSLEERFSAYVTRKSLKGDLRKGRSAPTND